MGTCQVMRAAESARGGLVERGWISSFSAPYRPKAFISFIFLLKGSEGGLE